VVAGAHSDQWELDLRRLLLRFTLLRICNAWARSSASSWTRCLSRPEQPGSSDGPTQRHHLRIRPCGAHPNARCPLKYGKVCRGSSWPSSKRLCASTAVSDSAGDMPRPGAAASSGHTRRPAIQSCCAPTSCSRWIRPKILDKPAWGPFLEGLSKSIPVLRSAQLTVYISHT
jgi:hypothetical protein